ncbi:cysteine desulfurase family protein [Oribacterium sinus]|uniref:cysteine desulfurase n=1 Tax=Oribacterium sinus TaxID=237576 RepID=A0A930DLT1_9FIRM|nr:cysteine desulfurase family protein [Oribacterium sinus]MBF1273296.1 cysteine desulfurase [Oribacterium sinus]
MIYLDHAATTAVSKSVREAMLPYFSEDYGNPSSLYLFAQKAKKAVEDSRRSIAGLLGVNPREVYFTSGGTEADNWAILSAFYSAMGKKSSLSGSEAEQMSSLSGSEAEQKNSLSGSEVAGSEVAGQKQRQPHIICSAIEHHAILESCKFAESLGARVSRIPVDSEGFLDLEALEQAITEDTVLISVMAANNEMGTIQDLRAIGEIAKKHGVLFHTDAVQAFGQIPLFLEEMGIDLLSASAHKLHGPKGVGLLVIRKGVRLPAFLHGGAQERGFRAGTENVPGIVGFAKAAEEAFAGMSEREKRKRELQKLFFRRLLEEVPGIKITGVNPLEASGEKRLSGNVHICIEGIEAESLLLLLDQKGICASAGSACASGSVEPSHVLLALGKSHVEAYSGLRLSFEEDLKEEELEFTVKAIREGVERLRRE